MSMFTSAINGIRSTVSNPKFYTSARAGMGRAVASAQAYAPKITGEARRIGAAYRGLDSTSKFMVKAAGYSAGSAVAGAAIDRKHRVRGGIMGGALGLLGVGGAYLDRNN